MPLPDSLQTKIDLWLSRGYVQRYEFGVFLPPSWVAVMLGQNLMPKGYDQRVDNMPQEALLKISKQMKHAINSSVNSAQNHLDFLKKYGATSNSKPMISNSKIGS
ncbi:MAG: tryptophan 7-halogenase, partial [Colwelliaceae bacterium]|nr:tryptophan 7-halogenase [Colwelliaceae bacterium]